MGDWPVFRLVPIMTSGLKSFLFGSETRQLVYKSLDANAMRGRAISQNLANVMTPGYLRKEVQFEEKVREAMDKKVAGRTTDDLHMEIDKGVDLSKIEPEVYEPDDPTNPGEINNVDVDIEAAKMAENQIQYQFNIRFASFEKYIAAIRGSSN